MVLYVVARTEDKIRCIESVFMSYIDSIQKPNANGPFVDVSPAAALDLEREVQIILT